MSKPLIQGLKALFAIGALSFAFNVAADDKVAAGIKDIPPDQIPEMDLPASSNPHDAPNIVLPSFAKTQLASAPDAESIVPVNGPIITTTRPIVPSGTLAFVRQEIEAYNRETPGKPIIMEIDSPGGEWTTMQSVLNVMAMSKNQVNTRCVAHAESAGAFILSAGKLREAWSSCQIVFHNVQIQTGDSPGGQRAVVDIAKDMKVQQIQFAYTLAQGINLLARTTGLPPEVAEAILSQDCLMPLDAAKALNVIDKIIDPLDAKANERKFAPTADNICIGYHLADDVVKKIKTFAAAPKPQR